MNNPYEYCSDELKDKLLQLRRSGLNRAAIAENLGVSRSVINKWMQSADADESAEEEAERDSPPPVQKRPQRPAKSATKVLGMPTATLKRLQRLANAEEPDVDQVILLEAENALLRNELEILRQIIDEYTGQLTARMRSEIDEAKRLTATLNKARRGRTG